jgi:hypothetical protein
MRSKRQIDQFLEHLERLAGIRFSLEARERIGNYLTEGISDSVLPSPRPSAIRTDLAGKKPAGLLRLRRFLDELVFHDSKTLLTLELNRPLMLPEPSGGSFMPPNIPPAPPRDPPKGAAPGDPSNDEDARLCDLFERFVVAGKVMGYDRCTLEGKGRTMLVFRLYQNNSEWPFDLAAKIPRVQVDAALRTRQLRAAFQRWAAFRGNPHLVRPIGWRQVDGLTFFLTEYAPQSLDAVFRATPRQRRIEVVIHALEQMAKLLDDMGKQRKFAPSWSLAKLRWSEDLGFLHTDPVGISHALRVDGPEPGEAPALLELGESLFDLLMGEHTGLRKRAALYASDLGCHGWLVDLVMGLLGVDNAQPPSDSADFARAIDPPPLRLLTERKDGDRFEYHWEPSGGAVHSRPVGIATNESVDHVRELVRELGELAEARLAAGYASRAKIDKQISEKYALITQQGAQCVLGKKLRKELAIRHGEALTILHDVARASVPWELLDEMCLHFPMSRSLKLAQKPALLPLPCDNHIRILLVHETFRHFPQCRAEVDAIEEELRNSPNHKRAQTERVELPVGPMDLLKLMEMRHIIHFAGHAQLRQNVAGWYIGEKSLLTAQEVVNVWEPAQGNRERRLAPLLVFANACMSATAPEPNAKLGLPYAFLRRGVGNYIGAVMSVPDSSQTVDFARQFYRSFFAGRTTGQSVLDARKYCRQGFYPPDLTFARYALYGDPKTTFPARRAEHAATASTAG